MEAGSTPNQGDPLGLFIRSIVAGVAIRVGALAAAFVTLAPAVVLFAFGYVPYKPLQVALGARLGDDEPVNFGARLVRALTVPWVLAEKVDFGSVSVVFRTSLLVPLLVLVSAFVVAGLYGRAMLKTARGRGTAVVVCAALVTAFYTILSAVVSFSIEGAEYSPSVKSYFWVPLVLNLVVGSFAFGVIALWREPLRSAARIAALLFTTLFLAGGLVFTIGINIWNPEGTNDPKRLRDLIETPSAWSNPTGAAVLPLAFGARAHLHAAETASPFRQYNGEDEYTYLPELAGYTERHESARLTGYAGTGGTLARLAAAVGAILVILLWLFAAIRTVRTLGAPRSLDGLRIGALVGSFGFLFLLVAEGVTTLSVSSEARWGVDFGPAVQTGAELIALTALGGIVYAALRPAPFRYTPLALRVVLPTGVWPPPGAAPPTPEEPARGSQEFCESCGTRLSDDARFCPACGTPRA